VSGYFYLPEFAKSMILIEEIEKRKTMYTAEQVPEPGRLIHSPHRLTTLALVAVSGAPFLGLAE
jgi:hypothetical protein